ncbi:uncharacterized protein LOC129873581 [Solanum dulcamara]|uniref:uncharacterized protein LOC129873581 n=1 Tax=Solanum dulcamara TaxID=45834 RepID=UPI0024861949|nr:uncharacterized protein LOC129873581 [Solanum dulcamara]
MVILNSLYVNRRKELWESLGHIAEQHSHPWLIDGDFNVILSWEEKLGGLPVFYQEIEDFTNFITVCELTDMGYIGSTYTWWNGRTDDACIFKKLDRVLTNQKLQDEFPNTSVKHLIKKGSDHSPLEIQCSQTHEEIIRPFRFLNFWTKHAGFLDMVRTHWHTDFTVASETKENESLQKTAFQKIFARVISEEQNELIRRESCEDEVKNAVFALNGESSSGPDAQGFSKLTRGVKQGDLLSPTLFVIAAEALTRSSNALNGNEDFKRFGIPKWSPEVNHLAYADDTILFTSADKKSMRLMTKVLKKYERASGQMINLEKSNFSVHDKVLVGIISRIKVMTKIKQGNRIQTWQGKMLSYGGRAVLIKHVLQGMLIHLLSVLNPPIGVSCLHRILARFFWKHTEDTQGRRRSLIDVSNALFCKLWWNFRSKPSIWGSFMANKYSKKLHPVIAQSTQASTIWKKMILVRELVEHRIWWQMKMGCSSFWFDNWTSLGALYHILPEADDEEVEGWNIQKLRGYLPNEFVQQIIRKIPPLKVINANESPCWMLESNGKFSVKSAWGYIRRKEEKRISSDTFGQKITLQDVFFCMEGWKFRIPVDDLLQRMGIHVVSGCCQEPKQETLSHIFLTSSIASKLWRSFANFAGINIDGLQLFQVFHKWRTI